MASAVQATSPEHAAVIDFETLLAPVPGENPAGASLQYAGLYDEIRDARREEEGITQGDWQVDPKLADWPQVISLATEALATKTKDLQVAAWLTEALIKRHGLAGLRDGLRLLRGLHEQYWETVYPEIEDGDLEARANSLAWLDRQAALAVKEVPLTRSTVGQYSYLKFEESKQFDIPENLDQLESEQQERASETRQRAEREGRITGEQWRMAKNASRRAFYEELNTLLAESETEFQALDRVMDDKFGRETPGLGALKRALEEIRLLVDKLLKEKRALEPDPVPEVKAAEAGARAEANEAGTAGQATVGLGSTGPIRSRQEALRRLGEVAEYFRRTEPHSPVSYLVQRAIKWGEMPLELWLQDVIKDGTTLESLRETLGLKSSTEDSSWSSE